MARFDTRFGRQPAHEHLKREQIVARRVAKQLGIPPTHFYNALSGRTPPSVDLRSRLSGFLKTPVEKLFTKDALKATYLKDRP